ncbi:MAG TPA: formate dehydrogenase accessory sulfurtransferase FdhD, partial [Candidatus Limnocylindrales bacterium]|nr:formate dehydrogenase accessory sulfurtransferase FdhD [Candidatus Limnocylindrales bacterium]
MEQKRAVEKEVVVIRQDEREVKKDLVTLEAPLTIYLNGEELVTLLCTPEKMDRLALGFLRSEGLVATLEDIAAIRLQEDKGLIEVDLKSATGLAERIYGKRTITSGCGKGTVFFQALDSLRSQPLTSKLKLNAERVWDLMNSLQQRADLFKTTGGVHSAALADQARILFFCEDIGRHNALDKIIGECLLEGVTVEDKIIISSGRLSSEILLKAAKLQVPILISRAAPTSLSIELADALNITLVGFVRGRR